MPESYLSLGETQEIPRSSSRSGKIYAISLLLIGLGCAVYCTRGGASEDDPTITMPFQTLQGAKRTMQPVRASSARFPAQPANAQFSIQPITGRYPNRPLSVKQLGQQMVQNQYRAGVTAAAALRGQSPSRRSPGEARAMLGAVRFAALDGARSGCRGNQFCVNAVGLFFGTQTGKTEEVADKIAGEMGLETADIADIESGDLAGFDGLVVGAPTWHTGADTERSGTGWDEKLEEIRGLDLCGKPVAVFGVGDSAGYGDNFCDAIEELHSTFEAAGAKMLGYVDASGYQHTDSKSVKDGKFLGLPLDQDNEDDMTDDRVKNWVAQIKGEGMPGV